MEVEDVGVQKRDFNSGHDGVGREGVGRDCMISRKYEYL